MNRLLLALAAVLLSSAPALATGASCGGTGTVVGLSTLEYVETPCIALPVGGTPQCANCPGMRPYARDNGLYCLRREQHQVYGVRLSGKNEACRPLAVNRRTPVVPLHGLVRPAQAVAPVTHVATPAIAPRTAPAPAPAHIAPPRMAAPPHMAPPPAPPSHSGGNPGKPR
jgi:hypothetical protein